MSNSPKGQGHRLFEQLEARRLLSASISPGYQNDTQSIQNAINGAGAGGTIPLTAGTFHVSSTLNINGATIAGVAGKTLIQWTGGSGQPLIETGSNSQLQGVTLDGAGIHLTDHSSNVVITQDTIQNVHGTGIDAEGGSDNLQITQNSLQNIGGYGMVLYSINRAHVDGNTIDNAYEGIHAVNFLGTRAGQNCTFDNNTLTGIKRHGIEVQNPWYNLSVGWNTLSDFNVQPGGNSHIALSIATGPSNGTDAANVNVHDNVILGTGPGVPSNPNYCFTAIEIMGSGSIVDHNFIANWGWGVLDGFTTNWKVTNNAFVGVTSQNGKDAVPESHATPPSVDSGNTWSGSWDGTVPSSFTISNNGNSSNSLSPGSNSITPPAQTKPSAPVASKPNKPAANGKGNGTGTGKGNGGGNANGASSGYNAPSNFSSILLQALIGPR